MDSSSSSRISESGRSVVAACRAAETMHPLINNKSARGRRVFNTPVAPGCLLLLQEGDNLATGDILVLATAASLVFDQSFIEVFFTDYYSMWNTN